MKSTRTSYSPIGQVFGIKSRVVVLSQNTWKGLLYLPIVFTIASKIKKVFNRFSFYEIANCSQYESRVLINVCVFFIVLSFVSVKALSNENVWSKMDVIEDSNCYVTDV